jgi:hypothetical protein
MVTRNGDPTQESFFWASGRLNCGVHSSNGGPARNHIALNCSQLQRVVKAAPRNTNSNTNSGYCEAGAYSGRTFERQRPRLVKQLVTPAPASALYQNHMVSVCINRAEKQRKTAIFSAVAAWFSVWRWLCRFGQMAVKSRRKLSQPKLAIAEVTADAACGLRFVAAPAVTAGKPAHPTELVAPRAHA